MARVLCRGFFTHEPTALKTCRGYKPGPGEAELEFEMAGNKAIRQVIISSAPEPIRQSEFVEGTFAWHQVGSVLKWLEAQDPTFMRHTASERNGRDGDGQKVAGYGH